VQCVEVSKVRETHGNQQGNTASSGSDSQVRLTVQQTSRLSAIVGHRKKYIDEKQGAWHFAGAYEYKNFF